MTDFCGFCGAHKPPRRGEGTCEACDPVGVAKNVRKTRYGALVVRLRSGNQFSPVGAVLMEQAADAIEALRAEVARLSAPRGVIYGDPDAVASVTKDAERYRWLRDDCAFADLEAVFDRNAEDVDGYIDAAIDHTPTEPHPDHCLCDQCVTRENMDERVAKSKAFHDAAMKERT